MKNEIEDLVKVVKAALEYIDAIPKEIADSFPAMPGFDRDWAEEVIFSAPIAYQKIVAENMALKRVPATNSVAMLLALDSFRSESLPDVGLQKAFESLMYHRITPATDAYLAGIKADGVEEFAKYISLYNSGAKHHAINFAKHLREGLTNEF